MTTTATRDEILSTGAGSLAGFGVTSDTDVTYAVIGAVPGDSDSVYARSLRTGQLIKATRTGNANVRGRGEQVRVRIAFAEDTGDAAGTLAFSQAGGIGGIAPRMLFTA